MKGLLIGGIGFVLAAVIVFISAGAGHGTYLPAKILFPYTMMAAIYLGISVNPALMTLAIAQFPLYGVLLTAQKAVCMDRGLCSHCLRWHLFAAGKAMPFQTKFKTAHYPIGP